MRARRQLVVHNDRFGLYEGFQKVKPVKRNEYHHQIERVSVQIHKTERELTLASVILALRNELSHATSGGIREKRAVSRPPAEVAGGSEAHRDKEGVGGGDERDLQERNPKIGQRIERRGVVRPLLNDSEGEMLMRGVDSVREIIFQHSPCGVDHKPDQHNRRKERLRNPVVFALELRHRSSGTGRGIDSHKIQCLQPSTGMQRQISDIAKVTTTTPKSKMKSKDRSYKVS